MDQEVEKLDPEMRKVAIAHVSIHNKKNASVKSLQDLRIENFTAEKTDHLKGHAVAGGRGFQRVQVIISLVLVPKP